MEDANVSKNIFQEQLLEFFYNKRVSILTIAFLLTLILPISSNSRDSLNSLMESSVNIWVEALNNFYTNWLTTSTQLINDSTNNVFGFLQNFYNFYDALLNLNLDVVNTSGFLLTAIYILLPILIFYLLYKLIKYFQVHSFSKFTSELTPKKLIVILLFIPLVDDLILLEKFSINLRPIKALFAIILLIYWYVRDLQNEKGENKNSTILELLSWKKTLFLLISLVFLLTSIIFQRLGENYSINSLIQEINFPIWLDSNDIMESIIIGLIFLAFTWLLFQSYISNKPLSDVIKIKYNDYKTKKHFLYFILGIITLVPLIDTLLIQTPINEITFVVLNIPWFLGLIISNPLKLFVDLVTLAKISFDLIITSSREIFRGIIPVSPAESSFLGIIQPTLWFTIILFIAVLVIYLLFKNYHERKYQKKSNNRSFYVLIVFFAILLMFVYVFDSKNYLRIFGDLYEIQTGNLEIYVIFGIILTIVLLLLGVFLWGFTQVTRGRSRKIIASTILVNGTAVVIAVIMIVPFIWMLKNSLQTNIQNTKDFLSQGLVPDPFTTQNYAQLFDIFSPTYETLDYRIVTWLFNSLVVAIIVTGFLVIFSAMAGYVLAKRQFVGRKLLFTMVIAIMMVPPYVQVIPLYLELNRLGFVGSLLGITLPFLIQPFSIFLATEFMRGIPDDYLDAARVDGYSEFEIFRKIVLPLSIPVISVLIIINLIANWNSFIWPFLLLDSGVVSAPELRTLPLGMYRVNAELQEQIGVILALSTLIILPLFIILFLAQDYIKKGVTVEGLKG